MLSVPVFTTLFAAVAVAQSSIANLLVQDSDNGADDLVASLVNAGPSLTTYVMNCQPTLDADECGWGPGATFIVGSTTMDMTMSEDDFIWSAHCSYSSTSAAIAICTNVYSGSGANDPGTEDIDYNGGDNGDAPWLGITITNAVATSTSGSGSVTATGSSSGVVNTASTSASASAKDTTTGSESGSVTGSATEQVTASSSKTSATSSSTSTSGAPQITVISFALGGAAMLMAIAAL